MQLDSVTRLGEYDEEQIVERPCAMLRACRDTLLCYQALQEPPQWGEREARALELEEEDAPRLVCRERAELIHRTESRYPIGGHAEFFRRVLEGRFLQVDGLDRPVKVVREELKNVVERSDLAETLGLEHLAHPSFTSIQQINFGFGAVTGTSSCLRYESLMCLNTESRVAVSTS